MRCGRGFDGPQKGVRFGPFGSLGRSRRMQRPQTVSCNRVRSYEFKPCRLGRWRSHPHRTTTQSVSVPLSHLMVSLSPPLFPVDDISGGERTVCGGLLPVRNPRLLHRPMAGAALHDLHAGVYVHHSAADINRHLFINVHDDLK